MIFFKARQIWCRCIQTHGYTHTHTHIHISNVFVGSPIVLMPLRMFPAESARGRHLLPRGGQWRFKWCNHEIRQGGANFRSKNSLDFVKVKCWGEKLVLRIFWWHQMARKQLEFFRIEWDRKILTKHWWYNDFLFSRKFSCSTSRCISFPRDEHGNFLSLPFEQKGCKISWGLFGEKNYPCAQNYKIIPVRGDKISPWGCS